MENTLEVARSLKLRHGDLELRLADYSVHTFHRVPTYFFRMMSIDRAEELGTINLRIGSTPHIERYAGHIGYGVHAAHRGHHYAARSLGCCCRLRAVSASIRCGLPAIRRMQLRVAAWKLQGRNSLKSSKCLWTAGSASMAARCGSAGIGCRLRLAGTECAVACVLESGGATLRAGSRLNSERRPDPQFAGRRRLYR